MPPTLSILFDSFVNVRLLRPMPLLPARLLSYQYVRDISLVLCPALCSFAVGTVRTLPGQL